MAKIKFENGTTVNFEGNPTPQDVEEVAQKLGIGKTFVPEPKKPALGIMGTTAKVGEFLGLGGLGRGIAGAITARTPEYQKLKQYTEEGKISSEEFKKITEPVLPSSKEIAGSAIQTGLLAATAGLKVPQTILGKVAQTGLLSAGFGGAQAFGEGKSVQDVAKQAAISGVVGGATAGALAGATKLVKSGLEKISTTAWSSILKRTPTTVAKNPELEKRLAEQGIFGVSRNSLARNFGRQIQQTEMQIDDVLQGKDGKVSTWAVVEQLRKLYNSYSKIPGETASKQAIVNIVNDVMEKGTEISVTEANLLKRDIYRLITNSYGKGLLEIPAKKEAQKVIAFGLRKEIERIVPEVKNLNIKQAIFLNAKKAIEKTIARGTGKGVAGTGIGLTDLMLLFGGGLLGQQQEGIMGAGKYGLGLLAIKKGIESPATLSAISLGTQKLLNIFSTLSPTKQIMLYTLIAELSKKK